MLPKYLACPKDRKEEQRGRKPTFRCNALKKSLVLFNRYRDSIYTYRIFLPGSHRGGG